MNDAPIVFATGKTSTWVTVEKNRNSGMHFVYILQCENGKSYCGTTKNIIKRLVAHASGGGSEFTKKHPPLTLTYLDVFPTYLDAINMETQVFRVIRKDGELPSGVVREYQNIFVVIKELLKNHNKKWVINKLT
jgi:putative endonuclease